MVLCRVRYCEECEGEKCQRGGETRAAPEWRTERTDDGLCCGDFVFAPGNLCAEFAHLLFALGLFDGLFAFGVEFFAEAFLELGALLAGARVLDLLDLLLGALEGAEHHAKHAVAALALGGLVLLEDLALLVGAGACLLAVFYLFRGCCATVVVVVIGCGTFYAHAGCCGIRLGRDRSVVVVVGCERW